MSRGQRSLTAWLSLGCAALLAAASIVALSASSSRAQEARAAQEARSESDAAEHSTPGPQGERAGTEVGAEPGGGGARPVRSGERTGARVYSEACAACHGVQGQGTIGPALAGNRNLDRSDYLLAIILRGGDGMPAFHDRLDEREIAAVAGHLRTAWGNDFGGIDPGQLAAQWWRGAQDAAELYARTCARCHGAEGGGDFGPALAGNDNLRDPQYVAGKILHGQGGMPAFESLLDVSRITALAGFVRNAFGNEFGSVGLETVLSLHSRSRGEGDGELLVTVVPRGAAVSILGPDRFSHFASEGDWLRLTDLDAGAYSLTASLAGFPPAVATVAVGPGESGHVTLDLEAESQDGRESFAGLATMGSSGASTRDAAADSTPAAEYLRSCALCHGPSGRGGVGPALAGNANLQSAEFVLDRILRGSGAMPAFAHRLEDEQIAAVATHERSGLGNDFGSVSAEQVAEQRQGEGETADSAAQPDSGAVLYVRYCSACHGGFGGGGTAPPLRGNDYLASAGDVLSRIVMGGGGMPPFDGVLSTAEMAATADFIRLAWENEYGPVSLRQGQNYHGGSSSLEARPVGSGELR